MQSRNPKQLINDLKFVTSSKVTIDQAPAFFAGLVYEIILNKTTVPLNRDLPRIIEEFILTPARATPSVKNSNKTLPVFKEYIFKSRTAVAAKTSRMILEQFEFDAVLEASVALIQYIESIDFSPEPTKKTPSGGLSDELSHWLSNDRRN